MRLSYTDRPPMKLRHLCTTDGRPDRTPLPGKENHPINCVPRWEAEIYCASVGKRLPTDAEWEYAARSGREENYCPWGPLMERGANGNGNCRKLRIGRNEPTEPVCSHPDENTRHGLCDMSFNVGEYVTKTHGRETYPHEVGVQKDKGEPTYDLVRGRDINVMFEDSMVDEDSESVDVGFRCVRDPRFTGAQHGH